MYWAFGIKSEHSVGSSLRMVSVTTLCGQQRKEDKTKPSQTEGLTLYFLIIFYDISDV